MAICVMAVGVVARCHTFAQLNPHHVAAEFLDRTSPSVYRAAARPHYKGPAALVSLANFGLNVGGCRLSGARQTFLAQRGREIWHWGRFTWRRNSNNQAACAASRS